MNRLFCHQCGKEIVNTGMRCHCHPSDVPDWLRDAVRRGEVIVEEAERERARFRRGADAAIGLIRAQTRHQRRSKGIFYD